MTPAEQLCLACGLCCDGTLFGHVQLSSRDPVAKLKALGLPMSVSRAAKGTTKTHFPQPCVALCRDRTCRVYAHRPTQCRSFECGVFKDALAGRIEFAAALRLVKKARKQADKIRALLRKLGDADEHLALSARFLNVRQRMESGVANAGDGETYGELSLAVHTFDLLTHEKFYTPAS